MGIFDFAKKKKEPEKRSEEVSIGVIPEMDSELTAQEGDMQFSTTDPSFWFRGGNPNVNPDTALSLSAVYSCIDRIASSIAMIPISVKQVKGGKTSMVESHPLSNLLMLEPNANWSWFQLMQSFTAGALGWGNGLIEIKRNRRGEVYELKGLIPANTGLNRLLNLNWIYNTTDDDSNNYYISPEDVIHIRALDVKTDRMGKSPIRLHAELIASGLSAQKYASSFFKSGGKPSGLVGAKNVTTASNMEALIQNWMNASKNATESENRLVFLPADVTYTPISISPIDAMIVQQMKLTLSQISGIYNVPAYMIGDLDKANYSNMTQQAISFVTSTLMPWIVNMESEMRRKIFTTDEQLKGLRLSFDMNSLMRGTPSERSAIWTASITNGWRTRNQVRVEEGLEPSDQPGMDDYLMSVNTVAAPDETSNNDTQNTDNQNDNSQADNQGNQDNLED